MKKLTLFAGAMLLFLAATQPVSAQSVLNYNWGGVHVEPSQALALNLRMDKAAVVTTLNVLLTLEDRNGNILYQKYTTITNGQTVNWAAGWGLGGFGGGAGQATFDYYMESPLQVALAQSVNLVIPSIQVFVPGGASPWVDMLTPTLELIDTAPTYHVTAYGNNPHATVWAQRQ